VKDVKYTGERHIDVVGSVLSAVGMGGIVLGILIWEDGGGGVVAFISVGAIALASLAWWLVREKRLGIPALVDPDLFRSGLFRLGITGQMLQQIALGGTMIALPIFLQMVLEQNAFQAGLTLTPLSLSMFFVALIAGRRAGRRRPSRIIQAGFALAAVAALALIFVVPRADSGWWMVLPLVVMGIGLGLLVSQLNNYTLSPIEEERVSEAASVNSAAGSFGLSFGLAFAGALMLGTLAFSFDRLAHESTVLTPAEADQVSAALNENAEVMTNTHLTELLAGQPADVQAEIIRINTEARPRALQVALLVPLLAASAGFLSSFRMVRLPDPTPSEAAEMMVGG
jgi:hypothetical protein